MADKRNEIPKEILEKINGGTISESCDLMLELAAAGYGPYIKVNEDRDDLLDIEGMKEFFCRTRL